MKKAFLTLLALGVLATPMTARATVIDFESIPDGGFACFGGTCAFPDTPFIEDGFRLDAFEAFASWDSGNLSHTGSRALYNDFFGDPTTLTAVGGGVFALTSIDLSEAYFTGGIVTVLFTGTRSNSTTVSALFTLDGIFGNETFTFTGWNDLVSVTWFQDPDFHQFDNIVVTAAVPEPGSLALFGLGIAGLGLVRRLRSAH